MARVWVTNNVRVNLIPRCQINMPKVSTRILRQVVQFTADTEQEMAPVLTGALRDSIKGYVLGPENGLVRAGGGSVDYGPYQEYGTRYHGPQPFVRPAAEAAVAAINSVGNIESELLS